VENGEDSEDREILCRDISDEYRTTNYKKP
jgi:hypothetical protein